MKRALLVIDVQNEYFTGKLPVSHPSGSFNNILRIMDAAKQYNIPTAVIQNSAKSPESPVFRKGSYEWELHPEIAKRHRDILIEKNLPDSFTCTVLEKWLNDNNADTVTIIGYMTQNCCDTTARRAFHIGYGVEFLSDATGTLAITNAAGSVTAEDLHRAILVTQVRFSLIIGTDEWIGKLKDSML
ncbi:MAG: cysteine hydrolase [Candidatus Acididesulfobacter diazotrophicus]|jgi:nicotinamidase-related amidase|uniref:Cysteine hydrolase n=1 Tax=Candidatus Acididesulfobacter diazotrophicus TaxID=2597226 RepID=A0A519BM42_9DELT|nr:MAG: cysteine hydrolase [Candidatus Acididesulfobacter diazotrophicus]